MQTSEQEIQILRRMTAEEKIAVMHAMVRRAFELKEAGIRMARPDLDEADVRARARALVAGGEPSG